MTLRRALWASPLAVAVAVLAHLAAFGFLHAPGAGHAAELLTILAVSLGLGLFGSFGQGLFARPGRAIATEAACVYAPLILAAAGAVTFGLMEASEGHFALPAFFEAALASLPIAYLVSLGAFTARHLARAAGVRCATVIAIRMPAARAIAFVRHTRTSIVDSIFTRGTRRGRAPPVLI